jgi:small subunit ribosomal protein S17
MEKIIQQPKKVFKGTVVSDKMNKTAVVAITRFVKHPKYQKYVKITKNFKVHDENNSAKVGDTVQIVQTRPRSKDKHFEIVSNVSAS